MLTGLITNFVKSIGWIARVFVRESFGEAVAISGVGLWGKFGNCGGRTFQDTTDLIWGGKG